MIIVSSFLCHVVFTIQNHKRTQFCFCNIGIIVHGMENAKLWYSFTCSILFITIQLPKCKRTNARNSSESQHCYNMSNPVPSSGSAKLYKKNLLTLWIFPNCVFSYGNYIFNISAKCILYNWRHILFYQLSPILCFVAYCTILKENLVSPVQKYLLYIKQFKYVITVNYKHIYIHIYIYIYMLWIRILTTLKNFLRHNNKTKYGFNNCQ